MRTRRAGAYVLAGALAFGLTGAAAGFLWSLTDSPAFVLLEWAVGMGVLGWLLGGRRVAVIGAVVGAISFPVAYVVSSFFALADGSPLALSGALAAGAAGLLAGALTGAAVGGWRGAVTVAAGAGGGYALGTLIPRLLAGVTPASADVPGTAQALWSAGGEGLRTVVAGALIGLGFAALEAWRVRAYVGAVEQAGSPAEGPPSG